MQTYTKALIDKRLKDASIRLLGFLLSIAKENVVDTLTYEEIGGQIEMSSRSIARHIEQLSKAGYLDFEHRKKAPGVFHLKCLPFSNETQSTKEDITQTVPAIRDLNQATDTIKRLIDIIDVMSDRMTKLDVSTTNIAKQADKIDSLSSKLQLIRGLDSLPDEICSSQNSTTNNVKQVDSLSEKARTEKESIHIHVRDEKIASVPDSTTNNDKQVDTPDSQTLNVQEGISEEIKAWMASNRLSQSKASLVLETSRGTLRGWLKGSSPKISLSSIREKMLSYNKE